MQNIHCPSKFCSDFSALDCVHNSDPADVGTPQEANESGVVLHMSSHCTVNLYLSSTNISI